PGVAGAAAVREAPVGVVAHAHRHRRVRVRDAEERAPAANAVAAASASIPPRGREDQHAPDDADPAVAAVPGERDDLGHAAPLAGAAFAPDVESALETSDQERLGGGIAGRLRGSGSHRDQSFMCRCSNQCRIFLPPTTASSPSTMIPMNTYPAQWALSASSRYVFAAPAEIEM